MPSYTLDEVRVRACRERDSWWTVWAVDPLAIRLVRLVANRTSITPNQLTVAVLLLGLGRRRVSRSACGRFSSRGPSCTTCVSLRTAWTANSLG